MCAGPLSAPVLLLESEQREENNGRGREHAPIVTKTLNKPFATLSVISSISSSVALGSFNFSYVVLPSTAPGSAPAATALDEEEEGADVRAGWREKRDEERTR